MPAHAPPRASRAFNARPAYQLLKTLSVPRPWAHWLLSAAKRMTVREQLQRRQQLAAARQTEPAPMLELGEQQGSVVFAPQDLPGAEAAAAYCRRQYETFRSSGADDDLLQRNRNKPFLLSIAAGNEFARHPELLRFAVSHPILDAATRYLGTVPILEGMALWWTPPNDSAQSSQAWHVDELAPRQVKMLLNCLEVTEDQGPFHFLPAAISEQARRQLGHRGGRLGDEAVASTGQLDHLQQATGPAGSGVLLDSSRCLHFGSRGNRRDRLVLTFHFMPLDAPTETRYKLQLDQLPEGLQGLDEEQLLALGFV